MPRAWFSIETTRSRRPSNSLALGLMKSCGPFSASTPAHWEIDEGVDVVWLITLAISLISGSAPAAEPSRPPVKAEALETPPQVTAALEQPGVGLDEVLWPVQRLNRRPLGDRRGVGCRLAHHLGHQLDERLGTGGVADPPASHGVGLGDPVHGQGAVVERGLHL